MRRRDFTSSALISAALAMVVPTVTDAADSNGADQNVLFSEDAPGHWGAQVATKHVPQVSVSADTVSIKTPHPQSEEHYIVSHTVVLAGGRFLSRRTFSYKEAPASEHQLPDGYTGLVTVTSTCNRHDVWTKTVTV